MDNKLDELLAKHKQSVVNQKEQMKNASKERGEQINNFKEQFATLLNTTIRNKMKNITDRLTKNGHKVDIPEENKEREIAHPHLSYTIKIDGRAQNFVKVIFVGNYDHKEVLIRTIVSKQGIKETKNSYDIIAVTDDLIEQAIFNCFSKALEY